MPTYEYECSSCGHQWSVFQKITEDAVRVCPQCGKETAKRLISGGNFILKGGGWYADLYSKPPEKGSDTSSEGTKGSDSKVGGGAADGGTSSSDGGDGASSKAAKSSSGESKSKSTE